MIGLVARLWLWTLKVQVEVDPETALLLADSDRPIVFAFLHGKQFPLLAWKRRRPTVVMVSHSKDGARQAKALGFLGFTIVRGSSSRGGARGLAGIIRKLRAKGDAAHDAAFAVDGPRGPYGVPKPGVGMAAKAAGAHLVPVGSAMRRGKVLARAWDRFELPLPFTRVALRFGKAVMWDELEQAISEANFQADLAVSRKPMIPLREPLNAAAPSAVQCDGPPSCPACPVLYGKENRI